ncbi:MAG: cadmium-translocating P-type ATPase [Firmicutes bacterium]|nr:cadmium-translocating P-type ATPase [Bacillota bacterium]
MKTCSCSQCEAKSSINVNIFQKKDSLQKIMTALAGLLLLGGVIASFLNAPSPWPALCLGLSMALGIIGPAQKAWQVLKKGFSFDMNALMMIAVLGAAALGEWIEGATVVFLFTLGNALEAYTMDKSRLSLQQLMEMKPREATLLEGGEERKVPVEKLLPGQTVVIRPGERIPVDGHIIEGKAAIDQSSITGEYMPVLKAEGQKVFAGTLNTNGFLQVAVEKKADDTLLSGIIRLVEEAKHKKAPVQRLIDSFAAWYTPAVIVLAVFFATVPPLFLKQDFAPWLYRSLTLLLISCPCALVISTPVAVFSAISKGAKQGILFKGGLHLEQTGTISTVAFDKTGTLTLGKPQLKEARTLGGASREDLLQLAAKLSSFSEHPLSQAIKEAAAKDLDNITDSKKETCRHFQALPGKGIKGIIEGKSIYLGSKRFLQEDLKIDLTFLEEETKEQEELGNTLVFLSSGEMVKGYFVFSDRIKEKSRDALQELHKMQIHTALLTGDNKKTASAVGNQLHIADIRAELLPEEKQKIILELQQKRGKVAMVGDGINDAAALAAADLGIAVGDGSDTALETAGVVLLAEDIATLPAALKLGRRARFIIKQNIALALGLKLLALAAVFPGWLTLWLAVVADTGVSLLVILNAMRLLK